MSETRKPLPPGEMESTAELPPDFDRYQRMLFELQDEMAKLREIIENNKDKPAIIFAMRMADIPMKSGDFDFLLSGQLTYHIEILNQRPITKDKKQFAEEMHAIFAGRFLRADAILQTYVLPSIDPPSTEVQDFADRVHSLTAKLKKGMQDSLGVVFDDIQLMAPPQPNSEGYRQNRDEVDRWVPFVQSYKTHPAEIRQMVVKMYQNMRKELAPADPILEKAKQEKTTATLDLDKYRRVTDVLMWGYTRDGIREVPTEVTIKMGTETLGFITRYPE